MGLVDQMDQKQIVAPVDPQPNGPKDDAAKAIRFLLVKAAIFIGIPLVAAAVAVVVMLK